MSDLPRHIEQNIRTHGLLARGQRLLVAVSGGVDSMVLLQVLHELTPKHGWQLTLAHLNHALRGRSSDADERLVRRTAEKLKHPLRVERAEVRRFAQVHSMSLEMAARRLRHEFLARTAAQLRIPTIALAHQADDQVELFFLRLLRGSSGEGLAGMRWSNRSPADAKIEVVRPLLDQPRSAVLHYAAEAGIQFREDASNASLDIQRNRIRHEVLPLLRTKYQPALSKVVLRLMDILGSEAELATQAASAWLGQARKRNQLGKGLFDPSISFGKLPVAVQRRIVQLQLLRHGIKADYSLIEELRSAADTPVSIGRVQGTSDFCGSPGVPASGESNSLEHTYFGEGSASDHAPITAVRDSAGRVHLQKPQSHAFNASSMQVRLGARSGQTQFAGATIQWRIGRLKRTFHPRPAKGSESFDADKVGSSVLLRHWQPGDRFQPIGMAGPVKLQDFFTNQKIPASRRRQLIVAASASGELFWVEDMRISEWFKLSKETIHRLQWRWQRP